MVNCRKPRSDMVNERFPSGLHAFPRCMQRSVKPASLRTFVGMRGTRNVQRKVFRIEQMARGGRDTFRAAHRFAGEPSRPAEPGQPTERPLAVIRDDIARIRRELSLLINDGNDRRMARAAGELAAAVEGMETATQKILASTEVVDDCARILAAALTDDYHHGLTQDVQDHVIRIYEACNFQDLAGQRIGKVIQMLMMLEERLVATIERYNTTGEPVQAPPSNIDLINGPRLDGSSGHASQQDIDAMFA
jgi:chemotaxis protein CheZ